MSYSRYLNLFKALPVSERTESFSTDYLDCGVLIEESVLAYNKNIIKESIAQLIPSNSKMNQTFHKSWGKIRDASIEQLVAEQLTHYFTTYGLKSMGLYNSDTVYIPNEQLDLEDTGGITLYTLRGITPEEISEKVNSIISSGMALSESDLNDLVSVINDQALIPDPSTSKNKEMAVRLYNLLKITPKDPVEYLRLQVYLATNTTLLIKSKDAIEAIKAANKQNVFKSYEDLCGLTGLATIFNRFKPLFLAFKNPSSASTINKIRRLAVKHHRPMPEDYLSSVTKHLRNGTFDKYKFSASLSKVNIFRKVKLYQALGLYGDPNASGIVYSIRNGKSFSTTINKLNFSYDVIEANRLIKDSLAKDLSHLKGKKVFTDVDLTVPTSGKMFCGDVPFGSSFSTKDSLALGVSWKDVGGNSVDLDLSLTSIDGKTGWDGDYRNDNFLFSGDITSAPNGATEAHLVREDAKDGIYLLSLNYYNAGYYGNDEEVPFTLFVTKEDEYDRINKNSMASQDNILFWANSVIDGKRKQKSIGVLKVQNGIKTFHAFESKMGNNISAGSDDKSANMISFYSSYLDSLLYMDDLLRWAGAKIVNDPTKADIDLSMSSLTKDSLISLLTGDG